jgi:hypothetical protein
MAIYQANPPSATTSGSSGSNPFAAPSTSSALVPQGIRVQLPSGQIVTVSSQADVNALQQAVAQQQTQQAPIQIGTPTTTTTTTGNLIGTAADAFQAVSGFLAGSQYNLKLQDLNTAQTDLQTAYNNLKGTPGTPGPLLDCFIAVNEMINAAIAVLNVQITAVDMAAGGDAAKVAAQFINGSGGMGWGGNGTALALGAGAIGLGLLLRNNNSSSNSGSTGPIVLTR